MPRAERTGEASLLLVALEFGHRGQQGPDAAVPEADEAIAPRDLGLERDPGLEHAVRLGRDLALGDAPVARLHSAETIGKHVADLIAALHRLDIPGEGDEIAPIAVVPEQGDRRLDVAGGQRGVELAEEGGHPSIGRCVEHRILPMD